MPERVSYGTSRSGERRTKCPYVSFSQRSFSSAMSLLSSTRLAADPLSPRLAASPLSSKNGPRLSSNYLGCLRLTVEKVSGDDELLDLGRPLVELGDLGVPEVPLHRVFRDEAVAAVDLDGVRGHAHGHLGGEELGHGRLGAEGQTLVLEEGRPPREEARRLYARRH